MSLVDTLGLNEGIVHKDLRGIQGRLKHADGILPFLFRGGHVERGQQSDVRSAYDYRTTDTIDGLSLDQARRDEVHS